MKNYSQISLKLTEFLTSYLQKSGAKGFVLGVSGGVVVAGASRAAPSSSRYLVAKS